MTAAPTALCYYGGKSSIRQLTRWIVSHIPWDYRTAYIEPFAGMCGVLLSRKPVSTELVNDANKRLINWWQVVRDRPEELAHLLDWTHQKSDIEFDAARRDLDCADPVRRAAAFTIVVNGSLQHTDAAHNSISHRYTPSGGGSKLWGRADILRLRDRMAGVQLTTLDACELLERTIPSDEAMIYVDPPYRTAHTDNYRFLPDFDRLQELLLAQKGKVAVSGYNDEWDRLGWRCAELPSQAFALNSATGEQIKLARREKLWMNYDSVPTLFDPHDQGLAS